MATPLHILISSLDDSQADRLAELYSRQASTPCRLHICDDIKTTHDCLRQQEVDIILLGNCSNCASAPIFEALHGQCPDTPIIVLCPEYDGELALQFIRLGAQECLSLDGLDGNHLLRATMFAVERQRVRDHELRLAAMARTQEVPEWASAPIGNVGPYQLHGLLGRGSSALVYLVSRKDDLADKWYALKLLTLTGDAGQDRIRTQRFIREAKSMAAIRHPAIVELYELAFTEDDHRPYLVLEYVAGQNMEDCFAELLRLDHDAKTRLIRQLAEGLAAMHARDVCHRDFKPQNIIMTDDLTVKITDLGIVQKVCDSHSGFEIIGTPAYMAPEAFTSPHVDAVCDIFSLGVIAYRLYLGQWPFPGDSLQELARAVRTTRPVDPLDIDPSFPPMLRDILAHMLRREPGLRYQSAARIVKDLDTFLRKPASRTWRLPSRRKAADDWA